MWRCHAENGRWWDDLHLPMAVGDVTATPETQPLLYVFLSIGQCSKEEAENPARSQDCPVRPLTAEAAALPSPQGVYLKVCLTPTLKCKGGGGGDVSPTHGFHRAHTAVGMAIPEVQG